MVLTDLAVVLLQEFSTHKEIGEAMGIDEGTSRSQLAKARKALQEMIENNEHVRL